MNEVKRGDVLFDPRDHERVEVITKQPGYLWVKSITEDLMKFHYRIEDDDVPNWVKV